MRRALMLALVGLAACDYGFPPETLVDSMRLLGVRSSPADVAPGQTATLSALVPDPSRAEPPTLLWVGCEADAFNLNRSPCADTRILSDPGALTGGTGELPAGVSLIGFNTLASYTPPATLFEVFPPMDPARTTGTVGLVVLFAVAETVSPTASREELEALFARVQRREVRSIVSLFRLRVFEGGERNVNPPPASLLVNWQPLPRGAHVLVPEGGFAMLDLELPGDAFERYTVVRPTSREEVSERILAAWYATTGRFSEDRVSVGDPVKSVLFGPGGDEASDVVPADREGTLWAVLRDSRGGQSWQSWPMFVCARDAAAVEVSQVAWPAGGSRVVTLSGERLDQVLEVVVDGVALEGGAYSQARRTWEGLVPADVAVGTPRGTVVTRGCARVPLVAP